MKATLPFFVFTVLFSSAAMAQCGGGSSSSSSDGGSWGASSSDGSSDAYGYGGGSWEPAPLRIGYAYRMIPESYTNYFSEDRIPQSWDWNAPEHGIDLSYAPGTDERWQFGTRFTYRELGTAGSELYFAPTPGSEGKPLSIGFYKKATTFSQDLYAEYALFSFGKHNIRVLAHGGLGYTYQRATARLDYKDTCDCDQFGAGARETSTVLSATMGLGAQFEYAFFGVKALTGFRFRQRTDFISADQFGQWQPAFNAEGYDYSGLPDRDRFSITSVDQPAVESRTDQFFVQLTFYFYLGWTHDTVAAAKRRAARQAARNE